MSDKKYYWLKLKKDFFKRHDIQIIEAMPNGKDYILFYLKMLVESVDHDGNLRFSDTIPYNENMLATITSTNIDVVRSAMKVFSELNMIELLEDKTIYMLEVEKMLGTETYWAEKKRKQRNIGHCPQSVPLLSNVSNQEIDIDKDIDKDIELDIDKEINNKTKNKSKGYEVIIDSYSENIELKATIFDFIKMRKEIKKPMTDRALTLLLNELNKLSKNDDEKIKILNQSIVSSWSSVYELKTDIKTTTPSRQSEFGKAY